MDENDTLDFEKPLGHNYELGQSIPLGKSYELGNNNVLGIGRAIKEEMQEKKIDSSVLNDKPRIKASDFKKSEEKQQDFIIYEIIDKEIEDKNEEIKQQ